MGIFDFIKGELIEIIEWTDDSRDTLSYRWPDDDKNIKNGAQLIVRESQMVQFVATGAVRRPVRARASTRFPPRTSRSCRASTAGSTASNRRSSATSTISTRACSPATSGAPRTR